MSAIGLDEALNGDPKDEETSEETTDETTEETSEETTEETPEETPEPKETPESAEDELPNDVKGLKQALAATRSQNRELKETVLGFQGKLEAFERFVQPQQNPQGKQKSEEELEEERDAMLAELAENPDEFINNRVYQVARNMKRQDDIEEMAATHDDYVEMVKVFQDAAKDDQKLVAEFDAARNQAKFAYQKGQEISRFKNLGVSNYAEFEAKLREKWDAEQAEKTKKQDRLNAAGNVPPSTATARGGSSAPQPAFTGPPSLETLLPE